MTTATLTRSVFDFGIVRTLGKIGDMFVSIAAAQRAAVDFERMNDMTDAQLGANGLSRGDLPRVIFDRHFN